MLNKEELKALVEHEKKNLSFYAQFYDTLKERFSDRELEKDIDLHLDRLSDLLKKLKD